MGVREWLTGRKSTGPAATSEVAQQFALGWQAFPWWREQSEGDFSKVTREFILSIPAALKARNIIVGTIASLPIEVLDADNNVVRSRLLEQIDPDVPNPVTMASLVEDLIFDAIGWLQVLGRDADNFPIWARRIDPLVVSAQPPPGVILAELPSDFVLGSTLWVGGQPTPARDMIRFDSPNPPLREAGARAFRRAHKYEQAAEMYANSPQMRGYFKPAENADPGQVEIDNAMADWETRRRAQSTGYVPSAFEYVPVDIMSPADLQLSELIGKATIGIANMFGLDSEDLNVPTTTRTYKNAVDRRQDKINENYASLVAAISARLSMGDITRQRQRVCFSWDRYLEPNPTDRATIDAGLIAAEIIAPSEARADWGKAPMTAAQRAELAPPEPVTPPGQSTVDGGGATVTPINSRTRRAYGADQGRAWQPVEIAQGMTMASTEPGLIFDSPMPVPGSFQVDVDRRTITGLIVPWNEVGRSGGRRWRFAPGALQFEMGQINRIKLLVDHDNSQPVGKMERTWSDETGQWATFRVAATDLGTRALVEAAQGARDGLSVGIGFAGNEDGVVSVADPIFPGVTYITSAPWRETSLVALPAFDGARATTVRMTGQPTMMGAPVFCTSCGQWHAQNVACPAPPNNGNQTNTGMAFGQQYQAPPQAPVQPQQGQNGNQGQPPTYTPEQAAAMFGALQRMGNQTPQAQQHQQEAQRGTPNGGQGQPAQGQNGGQGGVQFTPELISAMFQAMNAARPQHQPEQPANVNPLARPLPGQPAAPGQAPTAQVSEAPLYRFDGNKGQRCFTSDLYDGTFKGNADLRAKAEQFIGDQMAKAFANITVANTTTLNPIINRPDLWVPNLYFTRPIGSMVTGGVVTEITQQKLPKFSSSSGLAQSHAEGTEPTEGSYSTTSQTVTPAAIDGLLKVNREVVDQGGTPQADQIMWNEMTQFYAKLLEQRLVDALQALSLSDTPIVGINATLQASLIAYFATLQYVAGGDRYRGLALEQGLYTAIAGAVDNDGRALFPMLSPTNAQGTTAADLSAVRIANKVGVPAWALASGNGGPDKSFLFVPESVYQWFSPPRRIDLNQVAVSYVGIGLWGYSAEFITRNADVVQLSYSAG